MTLPASSLRRALRLPLSAVALFGLALFPLTARAQIDDPGLAPPPPPATTPTPPATKPAPTPPPPAPIRPVPTPRPPQPPHVVTPPPPAAIPPGSEVPIKEEVKEEVITNPAAAISDDEWERQLAAPSLNGGVGLYRVMTPEVGLPLNFRVASHMQVFTGDNFLIAGSGGNPGDHDSRFLGDLTIGLTGPDVLVLRNLELYLAILNSSNENKRVDVGRTDPTVILSLGDVLVGLHGGGEVYKGLSIGANFNVRFFNSISDVTANFDATNIDADLLAGFDVRRVAPKVPLAFYLNAGYLSDRSLNLLPANQCSTSVSNDACIRSRVVETFAYGLGVSRVKLALAAAAPVRFHVPWGIFGVEPFVEYHYERAVGDGDLTVANALTRDGRIATNRIANQNIQYLTAGLRLRPVARLVLDFGADFGLQSPGFQYGPPLPAWNLVFGAAYTYDPTGSNTKIIKRTITRTVAVSRPPVEGRLRGIVRDAKTKKPLSGAIVKYQGLQLSPQATADDGTFLSYGLPPGNISIEVSRGDDYEVQDAVEQVEANTETPVEVMLKPRPPREGRVHLKFVDDKGQPVSGVSVRFVGPITRDASPEGEGMMAQLPPGEYTASIDSPGYLSREKQVTVVSGEDQAIEIALRKRPAVSHVTLTKDQIVIKGTIHFGTGNAIILPDGQQILDEVADVLAKNPQIRKVSVEGHTDNRGNAAKNLQLSKDRAAAVVAYLVKQGVSPDRLVSEGYGATRPLVPNLTAANRAKNRRVEFKILDQGGAAFPQ